MYCQKNSCILCASVFRRAAACMYYVCPQERTIGVHISSWYTQNPAANFNLSVQNRCLCLWSNQCGVHYPSAVMLIKPSVSVNSHICLTKHRWNSVHLAARQCFFATETVKCRDHLESRDPRSLQTSDAGNGFGRLQENRYIRLVNIDPTN